MKTEKQVIQLEKLQIKVTEMIKGLKGVFWRQKKYTPKKQDLVSI